MDRDQLWKLVFGLAIFGSVTILVNVSCASGPYTYLGDGIYRGAGGGHYLRETHRKPVTVKYLSGGCWYTRREYRTSYRWTPIALESDTYNLKVAAQKGWKELMVIAEMKAEEQDAFNTALALRQRKRGVLYQPASAGRGAPGYGARGYQSNALLTQSVYGYPTAQSYAGAASNALGQNLVDMQAATRMFMAANDSQNQIAANVLEIMRQGAALEHAKGRYIRDVTVAEMLTRIATQPETHTREETGTTGVGVSPVAPVPPPLPPSQQEVLRNPEQVLLAAQGLITQRCISCHNATDPPKGLDLTDWTALALDEKQKVLTSISQGTMPIDINDWADNQKVTPTPLKRAEVSLIENATLAFALRSN